MPNHMIVDRQRMLKNNGKNPHKINPMQTHIKKDTCPIKPIVGSAQKTKEIKLD